MIVTFIEAIQGISKGRELMAILQGGPCLVMSSRGAVLDVRGSRAHTYAGKATDYLSIEWRVFTREQLQRAQEQARQAEETK